MEDCSHSEDAGVRCSGPDTTRSCIKPKDCLINNGFFQTVSGRNITCGKCSPDCATCEKTAESCISCVPGTRLLVIRVQVEIHLNN